MDPKERLYKLMLILGLVVDQMSALFEEHPELNDQVDIQNIIPMSLDEWSLDVNAWLDNFEQSERG